jgi:hypothetical protein
VARLPKTSVPEPNVQVAKISAFQAVSVAVVTGLTSVALGFLAGQRASGSGPAQSVPDQSKATAQVVSVAKHLVADRLEDRLEDSNGKREISSDPDLYFKRVKLAVFDSIGDFEASPDALRGGIDDLMSRGAPLSKLQADSIVAALPVTLGTRYRWLKDTVLPLIQADEARKSFAQRSATATAPLPKDFQIVPGRVSTETFSDMARIKAEIELIKQHLG